MQMKFRLILAEVPNNNVHPKQIGYGHFTESFDRIRLMPPCLNYPSLEMPCSSIMTAAPRNARQNDRHCVPRRGPRDDPWHPPRGLRSTQDHSRHRSAYSVGAPLMRSKASTRPHHDAHRPAQRPVHHCSSISDDPESGDKFRDS